jgi:hypothetical protein
MNEIEKVRTIDDITQEIHDLQNRTRRLVLGYAIEVGRRLVEAKEMLPHGEWGGWLKNKVGFSQRTAERCMTLYDAYGAEQIGIFGAEIKSTALTNLSFTNALLLVAVPEEEREEFAAEVDAEHISSRELEQAIRERDEALKKAEEAETARKEAEQEADKLDEERATLDAELREMKSRPIEYAVQEPDPGAVKAAVDEALADAEAHHKVQREQLEKKLEALEKKRDKLEQAVKEAEGKVKAAEAAGSGEADGLRAEVERLKKQLAMSDATAAEFRVIFETTQADLNRLLDLIGKASPDVAPKLRKALAALIDNVDDNLAGWAPTLPELHVPRLVEDDMDIPEDIDDQEDEEDE